MPNCLCHYDFSLLCIPLLDRIKLMKVIFSFIITLGLGLKNSLTLGYHQLIYLTANQLVYFTAMIIIVGLEQ